ncbi:glycoside hydrolase family 5 protein [Hyaloscypha bicolor E]|uniref:Glycoside hydrolase family 5 protein n=1 Tax=Hyaloscypha bicolor E TaxID=1095630 RepID=A0A2J6TJ70_9HELO|nr:glycoside hydrolase family 5 protein [Hyaloscypha bicolor E]PMD63069.1 glycoside hydrolase family 5 protein [Hyaloscypha bicolor E]
MRKSALLSLMSGAFGGVQSLAFRTISQSCTGSFTPISAAAAFAALDPGWNLGNTLDATPDEGSWNNARVQATTFSQIKAKGFKSIRIPDLQTYDKNIVTWAYHFVDSSPTWTVNATWMDRVETVVDQALALGVSVILNVHHDSWIWADVTASNANLTQIEEKFTRLWSQIGTRFACKSSKLIFEAINEPPGSTQAHGDELNKLNDMFLQAINAAGGWNSQRVVSLSGLGMDTVKTSQFFVKPELFPNQPWGLQFHYYSPYDFVTSAWGKTIWGSDSDKAALVSDFQLFKSNFTSVPAFVGEFGASPVTTEPAARWKWFDFIARTAKSFNYPLILWDSGADDFNRPANTWNDPVTLDVWFNAAAGINNTLADSTTDPQATSQITGASLFHKVGEPVYSQSVTYLMNGNTLTSVKTSAGTALSSSQYSMPGGTLTLSETYLATLYNLTSTPGIKETLTLTFSSGTSLTLQIVQYSTPTMATTTYKIDTSTDLQMPITYAGLPVVAAVKAILTDGSFLVDDWTKYLGPLQQGRWSFGDWSCDKGTFSVNVQGLQVMKAANQTVTLTLEFFPRSLGANLLNITFTQ